MLRLLPMAALPILRHRTIGLGACLVDVPALAGTWDLRIGAKICHKLHRTGESFHIVSCSVHISMNLPWLSGNLRTADPTSGGIEEFAKLSVTALEVSVELQFCAERLLFSLWLLLFCASFFPLESLSTPEDCHCTKTESATRTNQNFIYCSHQSGVELTCRSLSQTDTGDHPDRNTTSKSIKLNPELYHARNTRANQLSRSSG